MSPEIKKRLSELRLIERRAWPNGPPWRTARGNRLVRGGAMTASKSFCTPNRLRPRNVADVRIRTNTHAGCHRS